MRKQTEVAGYGSTLGGNLLVLTHPGRNGILRQRLLDLDAALYGVRDHGYRQCVDALSVLRKVSRFLACESEEAFQEEETQLYPIAERKQPRLRGLLAELRQEHDILRAAVTEFSQELVHFNATGSSHQLVCVGRKLLDFYRQHLDREERELIRVILLDLSDNESCARDHLSAGFEVP